METLKQKYYIEIKTEARYVESLKPGKLLYLNEGKIYLSNRETINETSNVYTDKRENAKYYSTKKEALNQLRCLGKIHNGLIKTNVSESVIR